MRKKMTALAIVNQPPLVPEVINDVEEYVVRIKKAYGNSIRHVIEMGNILIEAKDKLDHGEWLKIFKAKEMPFGISSADKLMAIARNKIISNSEFVPNLPSSWGTLYQLTTIDNLQECIDTGKIHPDMKRKEVNELLGKEKEKKKFSTMDSEHRLYKFIRNEYEQWPNSVRKVRFKDAIESILERICHD